ncbi:MAG: TAXI family TRAP transporter solute-binding subunit [Sulfitobacter sp.]
MKFIKHSLLCAALAVAAPAAAEEINLPKQMSWTAYNTGSAGFNQAVAIGGAIQEATGTSLRVLPGKNDVSRTEPLRQGRVQFSATGVGGSFMAQEGAFEFGAKNWGPQDVRVLIANSGGSVGLTVAVAGDAGIETYADMRGKRVAWIAGAPGLNVNTEAYLAYGGLTWDDVERVDFGGYGASWKGLIEGQVDAVFGSTNTGSAYEAASSPRGLHWPEISPEDDEAFARMTKVAPFYTRSRVTVGAEIDEGEGLNGATYAYPVLIAMSDSDADLAKNMTKAMVELFSSYDGKAPGIAGWAVGEQNFEWVVPYHEGAIAYYTEIGVWSDAAQAHNDQLIERQKLLKATWDALMAENPDDWEAAWGDARRKALADAGMQVVF